MTVKKEKDNNKLIVRITGSVDTNTSEDLRNEIIDELDDIAVVWFDMKEMDYISSAGLRVLLETYQTIEPDEGKIVLANVREELREIFVLTGFSGFMEMND